MKRIRITRVGSTVQFETVTVDDTENVFFLNLDPQAPHHPEISSNQMGPAPSPPSSQCFPQPSYGCLIAGHQNERGTINMVAPPAMPPATAKSAKAAKAPSTSKKRKPAKPSTTKRRKTTKASASKSRKATKKASTSKSKKTTKTHSTAKPKKR